MADTARRTAWTVALDGGGVAGDRVGGKAAAIDRLIAAGFSVPASAAVTADAYLRFLETDEIHEAVAHLPPVDEVDDTDAEARRLADVFAGAELPGDVAEAIVDAAAAVAGRSGATGAVAVRSSATVEDAAAASYAGQFTSVVGCEPGDEVLDAVRRVWASAWSPAVRAYREAVDDRDELAMGVLLMDVVDARHAGVVFTHDPEDDTRLRIEMVEGAGEQLVSGDVTPERTLLPRRDPASGLGDADPDFLAELAETALAVEQELGGAPQDIEWAHDGEQLWILQSRPITVEGRPEGDAGDGDEPARGGTVADDGFDSPVDDHAHTPAGVREMAPGVLPPLVWTLLAPRLEEGFRSLFAALGVLPVPELDQGHHVIGRFRGRAALDLDLLRAVAHRLPGQSPAELERQYVGEVVSGRADDDEDDEGASGGLRSLRPLLRAVRLRATMRKEAGVVIDATDRLLEHRPDLEELPAHELLRYHHAVLDLAARAIATEVAIAALAANAYRLLERYLATVVEPGRASGEAQRLTAGAVGAAPPFDVEHVLGVVAPGSDLDRALDEATGDDVVQRIRAVEGGDQLLGRLDDVLDRAGSVRVFAGVRWRDRPDAALAALRRSRQHGERDEIDHQVRLDELEHRVTSTWRWRLGRVVTGQVVDVRIRVLRRMVADAVELLGLREELKRTVLRLGGETRRVVDHVAGELTRTGALSRATDVELLSHAELLDAVTHGRLPDGDELARRRDARVEMEGAGPLPDRFDEAPDDGTRPSTGGAILAGRGAGPGRHTGRPVIVTDAGEADLHPGDVLVATSTDPSWTPLFVAAGALVVEHGGPLSHAAIVARELGVPAVLDVAGAVDRLTGVARVTVDGGEGTVEILDDHDGTDDGKEAPS